MVERLEAALDLLAPDQGVPVPAEKVGQDVTRGPIAGKRGRG